MKKFNFLMVISLLVILAVAGCKDGKPTEKVINIENHVSADTTLSGLKFGNFSDTLGHIPVKLYVLRNKNGMEVTFTNYGQRLVSLMVADRNGHLDDIVLGFSSLEEYTTANEKYFGSIIGRYGNRIAQGKFSLDDVTYDLIKNNGENHLHGGTKGFESVVWEVDSISENYIQFYRVSPHMEEGYPGNLDVRVKYHLSDTNALKIEYEATTDKKTPINLTHHSFFNLKGEGNGNVNNHILQLNANAYTPVDAGLIPTGEILSVENTPFDFRSPKAIGKDLDSEHQQIQFGKGYDHNFVLNDNPKNSEGLVFAAKVSEPQSGRVMEVFTNEPGIQFYGGNFLDGTAIGKKGMSYEFRGSLCLETQHFPNSPNQENFPSTILQPGQEYRSTCVYKFSTQ